MPMSLAVLRRRAASGIRARDAKVATFFAALAIPTMVTMLVSGLWHGAGYTFVLWGLMHGLMLCINHAWRQIRPGVWPDTVSYDRFMASAGLLLTFLSVVFAMVLFRSSTVEGAWMLWKGMTGGYGTTMPEAVLTGLGPIGGILIWLGVHPAWTSGSMLMGASLRIAVLLFIVFECPNTLQLLSAYQPALGIKPVTMSGPWFSRLAWQPSNRWAFGLACVALAGILSLGERPEFLYWRF